MHWTPGAVVALVISVGLVGPLAVTTIMLVSRGDALSQNAFSAFAAVYGVLAGGVAAWLGGRSRPGPPGGGGQGGEGR